MTRRNRLGCRDSNPKDSIMDRDKAKEALATLIAEFKNERKDLAAKLAGEDPDADKNAKAIVACQATLDQLAQINKRLTSTKINWAALAQ